MARNNRIVIYCRLAYLNCWKPVQMYGKQNYSLVALVSKDDQQTVSLIRSTIESVRQQSVSKYGNSLLSGSKTPLHDGDIEKPDNPIFKNCYYLNAKCKEAPQIVDQNVQPILCQLGGWEPYRGNAAGKLRHPGYGVQRTFVRESAPD